MEKRLLDVSDEADHELFSELCQRHLVTLGDEHDSDLEQVMVVVSGR